MFWKYPENRRRWTERKPQVPAFGNLPAYFRLRQIYERLQRKHAMFGTLEPTVSPNHLTQGSLPQGGFLKNMSQFPVTYKLVMADTLPKNVKKLQAYRQTQLVTKQGIDRKIENRGRRNHPYRSKVLVPLRPFNIPMAPIVRGLIGTKSIRGITL